MDVEVTALMCRIKTNNNTYGSVAPAGRQKVEWAVTQYWTCNTWNMTEASQCIYTLICPLTGPATNHCPGNGLGHLWIGEHPNVHIILVQLVIHYYASEHWLIATEPYDRIPTMESKMIITTVVSSFTKMIPNNHNLLIDCLYW